MRQERSRDMKTSKWIAAVLAAALFIAAIAALVGCTKEQPRTDVSPPPVVNEPMGGETTGEPTEPLEGTMTVKGSDTIVHLATAWAEAMMDKHEGLEPVSRISKPEWTLLKAGSQTLRNSWIQFSGPDHSGQGSRT